MRVVLLGRRPARQGALDRLRLDVPVGRDQRVALRRAREQPPAGAVDVVLEEPAVRRGVELAEPEVRRDGVEVGGAGQAVGEVDLVGVARAEVLLDAREGGGVRLGRRTCGGILALRGGCNPLRVRESPLERGFCGRRDLVLEDPHRTGPHPDRVGQGGVRGGGQVGARGVPEVAEPLLARGDPVLEHGEDVVADDRGSPAGVEGDLATGGGPRQRDVVLVEPADDRAAARPLAGTTAVEPEAARVPRRHRPEERDRVAHDPGSPRRRPEERSGGAEGRGVVSRKFRTSSAP